MSEMVDQMRADLIMLGASDRLMRAFEETVEQYPDGMTPIAVEWLARQASEHVLAPDK